MDRRSDRKAWQVACIGQVISSLTDGAVFLVLAGIFAVLLVLLLVVIIDVFLFVLVAHIPMDRMRVSLARD